MVKRRARLGGWHRLGIVVIAVWLLTVVAIAAYQFFFASGPSLFVTLSAEAFLDGRRVAIFRTRPLLVALVVIPLGAWILTYVFAVTARWVSAGFSHATRDSTADMFAGKSDKELCEWIAGFNEQSGLGYRLVGHHELQRRLRRPDAIRSWIAVGISLIALIVAIVTHFIQ